MSKTVGLYEGIFSEDSEQKLVEMILKAIKAQQKPTWWKRILYNKGLQMAINFIDKKLGDRLPQTYESEINDIVGIIYLAVMEKDREKLLKACQSFSEILKQHLPLEKLIKQQGEDVVFSAINLVITWLIAGNNGVALLAKKDPLLAK